MDFLFSGFVITIKVFFLKKDYHNNLLWTPNLKKNTLKSIKDVGFEKLYQIFLILIG